MEHEHAWPDDARNAGEARMNQADDGCTPGKDRPRGGSEDAPAPCKDGRGLHTLYLAGGCFWGLQAYLKRLPGVVSTVVGYANGSTENPTYRDVCNWNTGHAEAVSVTYDRDVLPTSVLLDAFFAAIDSTARNRQGNDVGTQYRTGVYYADERDKPCVEAAMAREQARQDRPVATEAEPLDGFYPAEDYHQDYLDKHPNGYCHIDPSAAESFAQRAGLRRQGAKPDV